MGSPEEDEGMVALVVIGVAEVTRGGAAPDPYAPCRPVSGAGRSDALSPELFQTAREQDVRAIVRRETGGDEGSSPGAWRRSPTARS